MQYKGFRHLTSRAGGGGGGGGGGVGGAAAPIHPEKSQSYQAII